MSYIIRNAKAKVKEKTKHFTKKKDLGGKEVIVEVALIVVAVALAIIFRDQISSVVSALITTAQTKISGIFS